MPAAWSWAKGLPASTASKLLLVAHQHHAGNADGIRDPKQVPGLHRRGKRALVDHQHGLPERGAHLPRALPRQPPLGDARVAGEEALQGLGLDAGFGRQRARRRGRRRDPDRAVAAPGGKLPGAVEHGGLAGAGIALHADHPVLRGEDGLHRLPLAHGQAALVQQRPGDPAPHDGTGCAPAALHQRDGLLLVGHRLVGGERLAPCRQAAGVQRAFLLQPRGGGLGVSDRHRSRFPGQRRGEQAGPGEHRLALGQVVHRPGQGRVRGVRRGPRRRIRSLVPAGSRPVRCGLPPGLDGPAHGAAPLHRAGRQRPGVEPEPVRLALPRLPQLGAVDVALRRPGHQRRALGRALVLRRRPQAAPLHRRLDLRPAGGVGIDNLARDARDLEPPVGVGLLDDVAERPQFPRQLAPVHGADQHLRGVQPLVGHGAPLAVRAPHHVGDHRVGMELGIEIARGLVGEGGDRRLLVPGTDHAARLGVLHPGLDNALLDPGEGPPHRPAVGLRDAGVAADQRGEGDGLRRGEGQVASRPVVEAAVLVPAAEPVSGPVRDLSRQHGLEYVGIDGTLEPERLGALAGPGAGLLVGGIVLGVVAVALVVADALGGRGDGADGDHHQ